MALVDRFQGRRLTFNDTITYRCAIVAAANPQAPPQPETDTSYTGMIVDFTERFIGVRADGFMGTKPLYYVFPSSIISVVPEKQIPRGCQSQTRR